MVTPEKRTGPWKLSELDSVPKNNLTVFSCFCCGGGSSMGYKLAGFTVLGGVEIDPEMAALYQKNHSPRFLFTQPIQSFRNSELPSELYELDVLDGSPPCSSFSMSGSREDAWGKSKKFREGQSEQILDDLFFHFIELAKRIRPKIVVAENVKGLVIGNARGYVKEIFEKFESAGYDTQLFLLNASRMGVPQRRQRTFFIARRSDLNLPRFELAFNEPEISVAKAWKDLIDQKGTPLTERGESLWRRTPRGKSFAKANNGSWFNWIRLSSKAPSNTMPATCRLTHPSEPRFLSDLEAVRLQSFPDDYCFGESDARYVCGMSVPPFMMQRIALLLAESLLPAST